MEAHNSLFDSGVKTIYSINLQEELWKAKSKFINSLHTI